MNSNGSDLTKEKFCVIVENRSFKANSAISSRGKYASLMIDVKKLRIKTDSSRDCRLGKHYDIVKTNSIRIKYYNAF